MKAEADMPGSAQEATGNDPSRTPQRGVPTNYRDPRISVCRGSRVIGCFDLVTRVRDFEPYEDEHEGIRQAVEWFKSRSGKVPEVVYPRLTNVKMSS